MALCKVYFENIENFFNSSFVPFLSEILCVMFIYIAHASQVLYNWPKFQHEEVIFQSFLAKDLYQTLNILNNIIFFVNSKFIC